MFIGFVAIVILVIVVIRQNSLSNKVDILKSDLQKLAKFVSYGSKGAVSTSPQPSVGHTSTVISSQQNISTPQTSDSLSSVPAQPAGGDRFVAWIKENWLLKLGVAMILIGFGWFISYAFVHDWIGEVGRVTLGLVVGSILAFFGTSRMQKNQVQGTTFLILGSAMVVLTTFAAQVVYSFFNPMVALFIPFVVSLFVATVGATYNKLNIGVYAVVIGFLAPILTHARIDPNLLYIYLAVTALSCVWLAIRKNWRVINALSVSGIFLYTISDVFMKQDNYFILTVLFCISFVYFIVSVLSIVKSGSDASSSDVFVAILNGALIMIATVSQVPEELRSLVLAGWMILFGFGSLYVFSKTLKQTLFYIYSLVAIVFLAVATSIELSGPSLIFAFAFEAVAISIGSFVITKKNQIGANLSLLMIAPALMAMPSFNMYRWTKGVLNEDFFVILVVGGLMMTLGIFFHLFKSKDDQASDSAGIPVVHIIVGSFYLYGLLWIALKAGLRSDNAITISLAIYSIIGIFAYFKGMSNGSRMWKHYGGALLILVVLRLMIVDVWAMPLALRIVTFVLVGALFISTAFITKKHEVKPIQ